MEKQLGLTAPLVAGCLVTDFGRLLGLALGARYTYFSVALGGRKIFIPIRCLEAISRDASF